MTRKEDPRGVSLISNDLLKALEEFYLKPLPRWMGSTSSIGVSTVNLTSKITAPVNAGGAWAKPLIAKTGAVSWSGTAASAMSSTHETPWWNTLVYSSHSRKAHLHESCCFESLCGLEGRWQPKSVLPDPSKQCKTCSTTYQKRVLEGLYER